MWPCSTNGIETEGGAEVLHATGLRGPAGGHGPAKRDGARGRPAPALLRSVLGVRSPHLRRELELTLLVPVGPRRVQRQGLDHAVQPQL